MMPATDIAKGVWLILLATLGIVLMNTCAKVASAVHSPIEMVCYRGIVALAIITPYMLVTRPGAVFKTRRIKAHLYRALVGNIAVGFVFWAYALLPMADATALMFSSPLFVAALSPLFLKERVDRFRWIAVGAGFAGILLIIRPSGEILFNTASLVGLAAAFSNALVDMALRNLGRTDDPLTTVFYFLFFGVLVTAPYAVCFGTLPGRELLPWILGIGGFAAIQQVAKTTAYRFAEASLLAPYTYSAILWATWLGWLLWGELPKLTVMVGTLVVTGSNFFIFWKEKQ